MDRVSPNVSRFLFALFVFYLLTASPDTSVAPAQEQLLVERRAEADLDIAHLVNRTYASRSVLRGDASLHVAQEDLTRAAALSREYDKDASLPLYANISSYLRGSWRSAKHELSRGDESADLPKWFGTARGDVSIALDSHWQSDNASEVLLQATFGSRSGWSSRSLRLEGVHDRSNGRLYLASDRNGSHGLSFTPAMATDEATFDSIRNATVAILRDRRVRDVFAAGADDYDGCDLYGYVQVHRLLGKPEAVARSEAEYLEHTGLPYATLQPVRVSGHLLSIKCDLRIELDAGGPRLLQVRQREQNLCLLALILVVALLYVNVRRLDSLTPSSLARLSFWSAAIQCLFDGYGAIVFLISGLANPQLLLPAFASSFLCFISVTLFGLRYLQLIFRMQRDLPRPAPPAAAATAPVDVTEEIEVPAGELPITNPRRTPRNLPPVAAPPPLPPAPTGAELERREFSTIYIWYYLVLLVLCGISLMAYYLPSAPRQVIILVISFLSTGAWWPQIYRNAVRGTRIAVPLSYVLQTSALRLAPAMYLFGWSTNILGLDVDYTAAAAVLAWAWLQVLALLAQDYLGPRCFLPKRVRDRMGIVDVHDYHDIWPILRRRAGLPPFYEPTDADGYGEAEQDDELDIDLGSDKRVKDDESSIGLLPLRRTRSADDVRRGAGTGTGTGTGTGIGHGIGGGALRGERPVEGAEFDDTCAICMSDLQLPSPSLELWRGHATAAERRLLRRAQSSHDDDDALFSHGSASAGPNTRTKASVGTNAGVGHGASVEKDGIVTTAHGFLLLSRGFMVTPCLHAFHADCLRGWLARKLRCPVCRASLPIE